LAGFALAPKPTKESFNTKNRHEKLDFFGLVWYKYCNSVLLVLKKPPFIVIGIRVVLFYIEAIICLALFFAKSERA
jgi:hypothetical protein